MTVTAVQNITCGNCSRVANGPDLKGWLIDPPLVVQGVRIGKCHACRTGQAPPAEGEKSCDGNCKGDYRPKVGIYYEAEWGRGFNKETFACWDPACVEQWADQTESECDHCGSDVDVDVWKFENGKRSRA